MRSTWSCRSSLLYFMRSRAILRAARHLASLSLWVVNLCKGRSDLRETCAAWKRFYTSFWQELYCSRVFDEGHTCHQVSTMGHLLLPMTLKNQFHAAGLIGSPTVPRILRLDRSCFLTQESPEASNARKRVGLVYNTLTYRLQIKDFTTLNIISGSGWCIGGFAKLDKWAFWIVYSQPWHLLQVAAWGHLVHEDALRQNVCTAIMTLSLRRTLALVYSLLCFKPASLDFAHGEEEQNMLRGVSLGICQRSSKHDLAEDKRARPHRSLESHHCTRVRMSGMCAAQA